MSILKTIAVAKLSLEASPAARGRSKTVRAETAKELMIVPDRNRAGGLGLVIVPDVRCLASSRSCIRRRIGRYFGNSSGAASPLAPRGLERNRPNDRRREHRPFEIGQLLSVEVGPGADRTEGPYGWAYHHTPLAVDFVFPLEPGIGPLPDHLLAEHAHDQQSRQKGHRQGGLGQPRLRCIRAAGQKLPHAATPTNDPMIPIATSACQNSGSVQTR